MVGRPEIDVEAVRTAADAHHRAGGYLGPVRARDSVRRLLDAAFDQVLKALTREPPAREDGDGGTPELAADRTESSEDVAS